MKEKQQTDITEKKDWAVPSLFILDFKMTKNGTNVQQQETTNNSTGS